MSTAPYWIQSSDFSHKDFPASQAREIEQALIGHDWEKEAERQQKLTTNGEDECPAGLGVMAEDGRQLIIRPDGHSRCEVEYSFFETVKMLGFIPRRKYFAGTLSNTPIAVAEGLIAPFLENDYAAVKTEIESRL